MNEWHVSRGYSILHCDKGQQLNEEVEVLVEYTLNIFINEIRYINLICTCRNLRELVIGNLYGEGIIRDISDIRNLEIDKERGKVSVRLQTDDIYKDMVEATEGIRTVTTACGKQHSIAYYIFNDVNIMPLEENYVIPVSAIFNVMERFQKGSEIYSLTRGIHSCALCDKSEIIYHMEDIGRHNAVDKILGKALMDQLDFSKTFIITSGRIPSDMITKIIKARIPIVVARSVPTDRAIEMAQKYNITLIGYARGGKMNVYANSERIDFDL